MRAIDIVERALKKYGPPVYVRHEIVHNKYVVECAEGEGRALRRRTSPRFPTARSRSSARMACRRSVEREAADRDLPVIDATCPLVTKVHNQGKRYVGQGRTVILIGHAGHPEVEGTMGQIPGPVVLVQTVADVDELDLPTDAPVAYVTQTTLSVDDTRDIIAALRPAVQRYPGPGHPGHLLRDPEPPKRGARSVQARRSSAGGRRHEQFQFQSPARDRRGSRAFRAI